MYCIDLVQSHKGTVNHGDRIKIFSLIQERSFLNQMFIKFSHVKVSPRVMMIQQLFLVNFLGLKQQCSISEKNVSRMDI